LDEAALGTVTQSAVYPKIICCFPPIGQNRIIKTDSKSTFGFINIILLYYVNVLKALKVKISLYGSSVSVAILIIYDE